jgi:LmbE family N-acetylglucosaminyl deacetylase
MTCNFRARHTVLVSVTFFITFVPAALAQRQLSGAASARLALQKLDSTGSVLMIAAHPDDENTALLAYFARGRNVRTGYLSLTRGEGGQNLIGSEQGDALGVIRTQELLAARKIDGAEQFFTRAIDFGFTKTPQETFEKWGHDKILSDVVWVIRRFQPDVIILRFSGTPRDGHGQHQASAILGREAFSAAADPRRFPEQLKLVEPWQAKRLMWNTFNFTPEQEREAAQLKERVEIDPGEYDPVLGFSYGEIAGMSRSMHKSQGMGTFERKGSQKNTLVTIAGDRATHDVFDGIDITWSRVPGGAVLDGIFQEACRQYDAEHPEKLVPLLLKARAAMAQLHHPVVERKRRELDEDIAMLSGLWLDATADKYATTPGGSFRVTRTVLNREAVPMEAEGKKLPRNMPVTLPDTIQIAATEPYTQPYWLREPKQGDTYTVSDQRLIGLAENPPLSESKFHVHIDGQEIEYTRPVVNRYTDRVLGELVRPIIVMPPVTVDMPNRAVMFPDAAARQVEVELKTEVGAASGELRVEAPAGWTVEPVSRSFELHGAGQEIAVPFRVTPPQQTARGTLKAVATVGGHAITVGMEVIDYQHIPPQAIFTNAATDLVRADIRLLAKNIGYVMGAGDEVPDSLRQMGATVTLLSGEDLARADLGRFDAIAIGVRAYNTRRDLRANQERLLDYIRNGGTVVVQYNTAEGGGPGGGPGPGGAGAPGGGGRGGGRGGGAPGGPGNAAGGGGGLANIGPYPLTIGRDRVTVEDAPIKFLDPESSLLHKPNEITQRDFEGWIQERGLYFASKWDLAYQELFETHDPGEQPLLGGTLYTRYGKGAYIFTGFSFFRELPAGVPGAYRLFANFLSAGRVQN